MENKVPIEEVLDHVCMIAIREIGAVVQDGKIIMRAGKVSHGAWKFFMKMADIVSSNQDGVDVYVQCGRLSWFAHRLVYVHQNKKPYRIDRRWLFNRKVRYFDMAIMEHKLTQHMRDVLKSFGYEKESQTYTLNTIYRLYYTCKNEN